MALRLPNLPEITRADPRLGEALRAIENYTALNVVQAAGTSVQPPPTQATPPASTPSTPPTITPPIPRVQPITAGGNRLVNQS